MKRIVLDEYFYLNPCRETYEALFREINIGFNKGLTSYPDCVKILSARLRIIEEMTQEEAENQIKANWVVQCPGA